jgi:CheY-like chemotaxis protein
VVDTGIGIPSDRLEAVFEPFTQAEGSTTRRFGGTGLGLTISRQFARGLGGDIVAHSEMGKGSVFSVTLDPGPLAGVRMLEPAEATAGPVDTGPVAGTTWQFPPRRVLVVDDGEANRELVRLVLEEVGLSVAGAENGQVVVDMATRERFDVILMDMQMPVMDGFTATRTLRQQGMKLPIFALTANAMKGFEREVLDAGCTGYLTKPVDIDLLLQTLDELLGRAGRHGQAGPPAAAWTVQRHRHRALQLVAGAVASPITRACGRWCSSPPDARQVAPPANWEARDFDTLASLALAEGSGGDRQAPSLRPHPGAVRQGARRAAHSRSRGRAAQHRRAPGGAGRCGGMSCTAKEQST